MCMRLGAAFLIDKQNAIGRFLKFFPMKRRYRSFFIVLIWHDGYAINNLYSIWSVVRSSVFSDNKN